MTGPNPFPYRLYLVISEAACNGRDFIHVAEQAIEGGVDIIQLREKDLTEDAFLIRARRLKELTDTHNIPLIINDNPVVAFLSDAAGIHLGNSDVSPVSVRDRWTDKRKMIGYSVEHPEQAYNERASGSSYLVISPVFRTPTKPDTITEWGLEGIRMIRALTGKPLVAIGNINRKNARSVLDAGADCIAVVSAICGAECPRQAAYELKNETLK